MRRRETLWVILVERETGEQVGCVGLDCRDDEGCTSLLQQQSRLGLSFESLGSVGRVWGLG